MTHPSFPTDEFKEIVGAAHFRIAAADDAIGGAPISYVAEPANAKEAARVLALANSSGISVIPRGGATKIGWGNPPRNAAIILSTAQLNQIIEHAAGDMTATVQAGCTIADFQNHLAKDGQRLAADPLWPARATIGGILATNDSGALRYAFGSLRDCLIGITVALADGTIARSGGKVVKNVAGYDLPKLFIGSMGTLGVIVEATFRLYPLARTRRTLVFQEPTTPRLRQILTTLAETSLLMAAVQIDAASDLPARVSVLIEAHANAIDDKASGVTAAACAVGAICLDSAADPWQQREQLFDVPGACVCKFTLPPATLSSLYDQLKAVAARRGVHWRLIGQAVGVGLLQLTSTEQARMIDAICDIRGQLAQAGGSFTVLRMPPDMRSVVNAWDDAGDALPLMRRIKAQFDPKDMLSPGRFVGGI